jgi:hypothetical protein
MGTMKRKKEERKKEERKKEERKKEERKRKRKRERARGDIITSGLDLRPSILRFV